MTIQYTDGRKCEGVILSRQYNVVRVALKGCDDIAIFRNLMSTWVSEDCEPVRLEYEWEGLPQGEGVSEADCICPKDLASRMIHLLMNCDQESPAENVPARPLVMAAGSCFPM